MSKENFCTQRWQEHYPRWRAWRHHLHQHPELAFDEQATAEFVAATLRSFGLTPQTGWAKTGVVAVLDGQRGPGRTVMLRADMDALPIEEANTFAHRSRHPGRMHACGHDGHTAMLLAAAEVLAQNPNFAGRVVFVFQPAEEGGAGARVMVGEGLLDAFAIDECYALHNWPGLPVGTFAVHSGPVMAGTLSFDLQFLGQGTHAAMPHLGQDVILAASQFVTLAQSVVSRAIAPTDAAVVSMTRFHAGSAYNVLPEEATLAGTVRALDPAVLAFVRQRLETLADGLAAGQGVRARFAWHDGYPPTINDARAAEYAVAAAASVVGEAAVRRDLPPSMGAEDFAYFLQQRPGAYVWIGNGPGEGGCVLHNAHYDFNDDILPLGVAFWCALVKQRCTA